MQQSYGVAYQPPSYQPGSNSYQSGSLPSGPESSRRDSLTASLTSAFQGNGQQQSLLQGEPGAGNLYGTCLSEFLLSIM
jgi:hypothetical protein